MSEEQDDFQLPGVPDGFGRLWTPHRLAYSETFRAGESSAGDGTTESSKQVETECAFCAAPGKSDEDGLIVHRGETVFVLMNLYPYNGGHVLVCPYRHVGEYDQLTVEETTEIAALTQNAMRAIRAIGRSDGFNVGINQGMVAGAGIPEHLHQHVVPRWQQDTNFMPIVARTRTMTRLLGEVREQLAAAWPQDS